MRQGVQRNARPLHSLAASRSAARTDEIPPRVRQRRPPIRTPMGPHLARGTVPQHCGCVDH